ncbi:MAG: ZIP family metal transporter [Parcubacteria group bacterium]|jgi:zinc and cadmium transporter
MVWIYTLVSVAIVSLISLIGVFTLSMKKERLEKILIYLVSLSTGTLLGDAFIHLIPEAYENSADSLSVGLYILAGILFFFIVEKFFHWRHCHHVPNEKHPHPFSYIILAGDTVHNFIDGLVIAASFLVSVPVGIATAIAVVLHEIPQEIGDFGSLVYGGFSRAKALLLNFATGVAAIVGAIIVLLVNTSVVDLNSFLVPFAAGGFIYIASADLIPELHKQTDIKKSVGQLAVFVVGIILMALLLKLG